MLLLVVRAAPGAVPRSLAQGAIDDHLAVLELPYCCSASPPMATKTATTTTTTTKPQQQQLNRGGPPSTPLPLGRPP